MTMIMYNTLMGFCASLGLIITARLLKTHFSGEIYKSGGYAVAYFILGLPLTVLSGAMTLSWPLKVNPAINIAFAEPCLVLGILMLAASFVLWKFATPTAGGASFVVEFFPTSMVIGALGVMLLIIASAIFSYNLIGDAPPQEPITGQFTGWENAAFGVVYSIAGLGCALFPLLSKKTKTKLVPTIYWLWTISGVLFLAFSLLNYRTHIGLLLNMQNGTNFRW